MVWILTAGREGFAWDIISLGRGRFFGYVAVWMQGWQLGQILGVTPCAAFSTSHELNIVPLAPAMGLGVKSLGALLVRKGR